MNNGYHWVRGFLSAEETRGWMERIASRPELFHAVAAKAGMNLSYSVVDGLRLREELPDLYKLGTHRLLDVAQEAVGKPLRLMRDPKRTIRLQRYTARDEGFLWHYDGGLYGALLTLVNTNGGATEVASPRLSRWMKPAPYVLFPFQRLMTLARSERLVAEAGDLLILHGGAILHRGVTAHDEGERLLLAVSYDPVDRKPTPLRDAVARRLNY